MSIGFIGSIAAGIISVATLAVLLSNNNTAGIVKNFFDGFAGSIKAAMGRG